MDQLYTLHPWAAYALTVAIVIGSGEIGHLIGKFLRRRAKPVASEPSTLEGAMLGLLALLIGFTFAMALSRFDARLAAVVQEANAIGTTSLRARMLPPAQANDVRKLLREYVQLRIDLFRSVPNPARLESAVRRSNALQEALWQHAMAAGAADPRSIQTGLFVQVLNEMIDQQEVRLAAARNHVPPVVFLMLDGVAMVTLAFSGYVGSLYRKQGPLPIAIIGLVTAVVIAIVGDLDVSQGGFITTNQLAIQDLERSLDQ